MNEPKCFPWKVDGPLCPVLQDPAIWLASIRQTEARHVIKKVAKRLRYSVSPRTNDDANFGKLLVWVLNTRQRREEVARTFKAEFINSLPGLLLETFWQDDATLRMILRPEDISHSDGDQRRFDAAKFSQWLAQKRYGDRSARSLAIVGAAFAMRQPGDANAILGALVTAAPCFGPLLVPPISEVQETWQHGNGSASSRGESAATHPAVTAAPPLRCQHEPAVDARLGGTASLHGSGSASPVDLFVIRELEHGTILLERFAESAAPISAAAREIVDRLDNLRVDDESGVMALTGTIAKNVTDDTQAALAAREWLRRLAAGCESEPVGRASEAEPALASLRNGTLAFATTRGLLRGQCAEIASLVRALIERTHARETKNATMLAEIHSVDDLLGRPRTKVCSGSANVIEAIIREQELEPLAKAASSDRVLYISTLRRRLVDQHDGLAVRVSGTQLQSRFDQLRQEIQVTDEPGEFGRLQRELSDFETEIADNPLTWDVAATAAAALGERSGSSLIRVIRALVAHDRAPEALALATVVQLVKEIEAFGVDDFSEFAGELLRASSNLSRSGETSLPWCDAIFQQPWIRELRRPDIQDRAVVQSLALALLIQEHLRGTRNEASLVYQLDLLSVFPADAYPTIRICLQGIATGRPVAVRTAAPESPTADAEKATLKLFRKDDHGGYMEQLAKGDKFHEVEKSHLFPRMERIFQEVRTLCEQRDWAGAAATASHRPEKLYMDACRAAGADPDDSQFFRSKSQNGYIQRFLNRLADYIAAARDEADRNVRDFVLHSTLCSEIDMLQRQDPRNHSFHDAVRETLGTVRPLAVGVDSALELLDRLCARFGPVASIATEYICGRCLSGPKARPGEDTVVQFLTMLSAPPPDGGIRRLRNAGCLRHALLVAESKRNADDSYHNVCAELRTLVTDREGDIGKRLARLSASPPASLRTEELAPFLAEGCFGYVDGVIAEAEQRVADSEKTARHETAAWIKRQLDQLPGLRHHAVQNPRSREWLRRVLDCAVSLEQLLLVAQARDVVSFDRDVMERAFATLDYLVESRAASFDEIDKYIQRLDPPPKEETPLHDLVSTAPFTAAWAMLSQTNDPEALATTWKDFVCAYCGGGLRDLLHKTLMQHRIDGCMLPCYETEFNFAWNSWLSRPMHLYLCFGEGRLADESSALLNELKSNTAILNVVFVPRGAGALKRAWRYSPVGSHYLIFDDPLLARSAAMAPRKGRPQHHVPLRHALNQTAQDLLVVNPFKSEGYVHFRRNLFVGRTDALRQLRDQPASAIWGGRRTGKTSLLQALSVNLQSVRYGEWSVAFVYADKRSDDPDLSIARVIAQELKLPSPGSLIEFEQSMISLCTRTQVAVLMDETDRYITLSREAHGREFPLARTLRGLVMRNSVNFKLVYAGFKELFHEVKRTGVESSDPFINILEPVSQDFKNLEVGEVDELMSYGFCDMLGIEMADDVARHVTQATYGHPAFVQRFCECLLGRISKRRRTEEAPKITKDDVDAVWAESVSDGSDGGTYIDYVKDTLAMNVSPLERVILLALSDDGRGPRSPDPKIYAENDIMRLLLERGVDSAAMPERADIRGALRTLTMTNMLTAVAGDAEKRYRVTYRSIVWLLNRIDLEVVRAGAKEAPFDFFTSLKLYHASQKAMAT